MIRALFGSLAILAASGAAWPQQPPAPEWPACGTVESLPREHWPAPDPRGWDTGRLERARGYFETLDSAAFMVVHRGEPVIAWGDIDVRYTAQSMRKPLVGAIIGQLVAEGALDLDATLAGMGIDDSDPALTEEERQATLRDLLLSRSGIMHDANYEVGGWRDLRIGVRERQPAGSFRGNWVYNNWVFNALGTIAEQGGRDTLGALFRDRVAGPLGMEDFRVFDVTYSERGSRAQQFFGYGSDHPAYMFEMSTRDLARFATLYLNCGRWDGREVVPEAWVRESIAGVDTYIGLSQNAYTGFDRYGYLWWVEDGGERPRFPQLEAAQPFYGASGNRGHFMLVFPHLDLVIVHQPPTLGGIGFEAQADRFRNGTPGVEDEDFERLVGMVLMAHPEAGGR